MSYILPIFRHIEEVGLNINSKDLLLLLYVSVLLYSYECG